MNTQRLVHLVERAQCLLLDFDGPICSVFANYPAPNVADQLRQLLVDQGVALPPQVREESDPMEILRYAGKMNRPDVVRKVEDALRDAELIAARSATPTPYAREVIVTAHQNGRRIAIVSNNSAEAIRAHLTARRLNSYIGAIVGRAYGDPDLMKPSPLPVLIALKELNAGPKECAMVGDSVSDIDSARAAGVHAIGYANKPGKREKLAHAYATIDSMLDLVALLSNDRP